MYKSYAYLTVVFNLAVMVVFQTLLSQKSSELSAGQIEVEKAFPNLLFKRPVDLQDARDGSSRLFVVEQEGVIRVFENSPDAIRAKVFLDLRDRVQYDEGEEGLLGMAFHPDFKKNGYFFVNYTASDPLRTVIARFEVKTAGADHADPDSQEIFLEFLQPYSNHNGGQIGFGPDGFLYIATGDGGAAADPYGNGQNLKTLLGKILRVDVNKKSNSKNYAIPKDNPFAGHKEYREEIYAYGLRNPWRFSWDKAGRLWTGDVGQNKFEEIDIIEKGGNYGWNIMEGFHCFKPAENCPAEGLKLPVVEYSHDEGLCVTGGFVYEGDAVKNLRGHYVYADYVNGKIWALRYKEGKNRKPLEIAHTHLNISSFGVDVRGELYLCAFDGKIYRFAER